MSPADDEPARDVAALPSTALPAAHRGAPRVRIAALVLVWLVPGLLQCAQELTYAQAAGIDDTSVARILLHFAPSWLPWALFTPLVLALTRRFPLRPSDLWRSLPLHLVFCLVLGATHLTLLGLVRVNFPPGPFPMPDLGTWLQRTLWSLHAQAEVLAYAGVVASGHAFEALRTAREREMRAVRLQAQLSAARLEALRGQLRPHFLFNTLNAIDVLIAEDPGRASEMLHRLSDLLRVSLSGGSGEHTLEEELAHLRAYLEIERVRFSDRLTVTYDISEDVRGVPVPSLFLQPLVENAVRHGIAPLAGGGAIEVRARRVGERLEVAVVDDGAGLRADFQERIGLGNTRQRLLETYGGEQELLIRAREGGGTEVLCRLPFELPRVDDTEGPRVG